jgi:biotin synthase
LRDFGLPDGKLQDVVKSGKPFMTSGCQGIDGEVACNRPYANCTPGPDIRNYPFIPEKNDVQNIYADLWQ